jgi:hypothetical protein
MPADDVFVVLKSLRVLAGLTVLGIVVLALAGAGGFLLRGSYPVTGGTGVVALIGVVAILCLGGGMAMLELSSRKAKAAGSFKPAAQAYRSGCRGAAGLNFLAGALTVAGIYSNGISNGLWIGQGIILGLNLLGLVLATPRVKHLRDLHWRPTLPVTRV